MNAKNRGGLYNDGGANQAGRMYETGAKARDDAVHRTKMRRSLARPVEDHELVFDQQRFSTQQDLEITPIYATN
jgi:hypothetical protein